MIVLYTRLLEGADQKKIWVHTHTQDIIPRPSDPVWPSPDLEAKPKLVGSSLDPNIRQIAGFMSLETSEWRDVAHTNMQDGHCRGTSSSFAGSRQACVVLLDKSNDHQIWSVASTVCYPGKGQLLKGREQLAKESDLIAKDLDLRTTKHSTLNVRLERFWIPTVARLRIRKLA